MAQETAKAALHAADGIWETLPILKEVFLTHSGAALINITKEFILGLDILRAYGNLGRQMLHLAGVEVSL
jgi:hypothetical protein